MNAPAQTTPAPAPARRKPPLVFKLVIVAFIGLVGLVVAEVFLAATRKDLVVGPMLTQRDPYYGYWLKPNFDGTAASSTGHTYHHRTNSRGHRAPEYIDAPAGHVICFGDSYTMAETVDFGKEYAALLRDALRPKGFEVVNFGRAGNGEGRWLKFLKRDLKDYNPKLVVMQMCSNDFGDNEVEWLYKVRDDGTLEELPVAKPGTADKIRDFVEAIPGVKHLRTYQLLKQEVRRLTGAQGFQHPETMDLTPEQIADQNALVSALLRASLEECKARGIPVIWMQVGMDPERHALVRAVFDEFGAVEFPVPSIEERPDLYHADDPHWNDAGQKFVGDGIMGLIQERAILGPPPAP